MSDLLHNILEEAKVEVSELKAVFRVCRETVKQFKVVEAKLKMATAELEHHRLECEEEDCMVEVHHKQLILDVDKFRLECKEIKSFLKKLEDIVDE